MIHGSGYEVQLIDILKKTLKDIHYGETVLEGIIENQDNLDPTAQELAKIFIEKRINIKKELFNKLIVELVEEIINEKLIDDSIINEVFDRIAQNMEE